VNGKGSVSSDERRVKEGEKTHGDLSEKHTGRRGESNILPIQNDTYWIYKASRPGGEGRKQQGRDEKELRK